MLISDLAEALATAEQRAMPAIEIMEDDLLAKRAKSDLEFVFKRGNFTEEQKSELIQAQLSDLRRAASRAAGFGPVDLFLSRLVEPLDKSLGASTELYYECDDVVV